MRSFYIALPEVAADRLRALARRERRSPRQQAAVLVLAALEREDARVDETRAARTSSRRRAVERQP